MSRHAFLLCLSVLLCACSATPAPEATPSDAPLPQESTDTHAGPTDTQAETTDAHAEATDATDDEDAAARAVSDAPDALSEEDSSTPAPDVIPSDSATTEGDSETPDAGDSGAEVMDTEATSSTCEGILAQANTLLLDAGSGCDAPDSCVMFEFPICGTFGCFLGAIRKDTSEADLATLNDTALEGLNGGCEPFHCGCGFPEGAPVCLQSQCRMCPGDCGDSCEDVKAALLAVAEPVATGCESDDDCAVLPVAPCDLSPAIQCHGLPHRVGADIGAVKKLLNGMTEVGCETFECDCQLTEAICDAGTCVPAM